jgi:hypothetical protein
MLELYRRPIAALALAILLASGTAPAQSAETPTTVDAATRKALIERIATLLERNYVFPDTGTAYARALREDLKRKRFGTITDPYELARTITDRLQGVHPDGHLRIMGPDPSSPLPPADLDLGQGPPTSPDSMVIDSLPPEMQKVMRARLEVERRTNHYFRKVEILPGNIGYLAIDQIAVLSFARATADAALAFLAGTDAVILDLRDNPGGVEGLNRYLVSHFVPPGQRLHLYSRFMRPTGDTQEVWSSSAPGATDLSARPLFVLINRSTASAAENISFTLQGLKLATLVGERTVGGAHSSVPVGLPGGFRMILPISRAFDPRTGRDWEGQGVQPDVPCASDSALVKAHGLAVDRLIALASNPKDRERLEQARAVFRARSAPPGATGLAAADYEGSFGSRRVWSENGRLWLQRQDDPRAPKLELIPTGRDTFLAERANRPLEFERNASGRVVRMKLQTPLDTWEVVDRSPR